MKLEKDFGQYGGQYVPETLMTVLKVLEKEYEEYCFTDEFKNEFMYYMKEYVGRPSALTYCERLTKELGGAKVYLKREDLNHTGAHKINNALAQALLAKHMGKTKVIAETGAGLQFLICIFEIDNLIHPDTVFEEIVEKEHPRMIFPDKLQSFLNGCG